jgi:hypothetical protein
MTSRSGWGFAYSEFRQPLVQLVSPITSIPTPEFHNMQADEPVIASIIRQIATLQTQYSSENTPAMAARGLLIRHDLPRALGTHASVFAERLGAHGAHMKIEGSDGIGRKTQAPWVRIFSGELSPSATTGFYMVIHFSVNGELCFVTVGCGATRWDNEKGDLVKSSDRDLKAKVDWAVSVLDKKGLEHSTFADTIAIGSEHSLPQSFEKATALCRTLPISGITDEAVVSAVAEALSLLSVIYDHYGQLGDLTPAEIAAIDIEAIANPRRRNATSRQGFGLTGAERKAVEQRAMEVTYEYLTKNGYDVKDVSATSSYDYHVRRGVEEIKVEVKGTTSESADAVLLTAKEVALHSSALETTALAIVSGIAFEQRGPQAKCSAGTLEFICPWDISQWDVVPTAFIVRRP